jgi:hypothetical protein
VALIPRGVSNFFLRRKTGKKIFFLNVWIECIVVSSEEYILVEAEEVLDKAKRCATLRQTFAFGHDGAILQQQGSSYALLPHDPARFCVRWERRR